MKLIVEVPDDFKAGECYDYTNGAKCPFAARGCWAGPKGFEKCPLKEAIQKIACPHWKPQENDQATCILVSTCGGVCNGGGGTISL